MIIGVVRRELREIFVGYKLLNYRITLFFPLGRCRRNGTCRNNRITRTRRNYKTILLKIYTILHGIRTM